MADPTVNIGKLGDILTGNWNARSLIPTFVFAGSGLLIWVFSHNLDCFLHSIEAWSNGKKVFCVLVGFFILGIATGFMEWFTPIWIRLLEGYEWPKKLRDLKVDALKKRLEPIADEYRQLSVRREQGLLTKKEKNNYLDHEEELFRYPKDFKRLLPTSFGNILRASEEYPYINYGLDFYFVWAHLWLLMPESAQKEISNAFQLLKERARFVFWSELALLFWPLLPLIGVYENQGLTIPCNLGISTIPCNLGISTLVITLVISFLVLLSQLFSKTHYSFVLRLVLFVTIGLFLYINLDRKCIITAAWVIGTILIIRMIIVPITYQGLCAAAISYSEYHRAVFDLYRFELYKHLHWPQPTSPETEFFEGLRLTEYVCRHSAPLDMRFVPFDESSEQLIEDLGFAHILPKTQEPETTNSETIQSLIAMGIVTPPIHPSRTDSESKNKKIKTDKKPLSEIIIEMRGK